MGKILNSVLTKKGITEDDLHKINQVVPGRLKNIDEMAAYLYSIKQTGQKLVILPDYDMDGIMSGVLGYAGLKELGFDVELYKPRPEMGYGFNAAVIDLLVQEHPEVRAILTCDNGATAFEGIQRAKDLALTVLVTDHHAMTKQNTGADCLVNPMQEGDTSELKGICGANVLLQVLMEYARSYTSFAELLEINRLQVFAGIGTVSDVMPMLHQNRKLVTNAIAICRLLFGDTGRLFLDSLDNTFEYKRVFYGLHMAIQRFIEEGKLSEPQDLNEEFFGFYLAPMFNSAKRMDEDMETVMRVFLGPEKDAEAGVARLFELNEARKALVQHYYEKMMADGGEFFPYIFETDAGSGIRGLLANKVMSTTGLPCFVVGENPDGTYSGSGRSPEWLKAQSIFTRLGFDLRGHEHAFGICFKGLYELKSFYAVLQVVLDEYKADHQEEEALSERFDYVLDSTGEMGFSIDIKEYTKFYYDLQELRPFGRLFEEPEGLLRIKNDGNFELNYIGQNQQHLKIELPQGFDVLLWNQAGSKQALLAQDDIYIRGKVSMSEFRDARSVNFVGQVMLDA